MLEVGSSSIRYHSGKENTLHISIFEPDWSAYGDICLSVSPPHHHHYSGYDAWAQAFPLEEELHLVKKAIRLAKKGKKMHIRGISLAESVQLLALYYEEKGFKDTLDRYHVSPREPLTVSISLRHFLFCDKDKLLLMTNDEGRMTNGISNSKILNPKNTSRPYYSIIPPIRTSHDLRAIQQAVRMGIIPLVEVFLGDEEFPPLCFQKELIPLFQLGQVCCYNWEKFAFPGKILKTPYSIS